VSKSPYGGDKWKSAILSSHWDGMSIVNHAKTYVKSLAKTRKNKACSPLDRMEPDVVMVEFLRWYLDKRGYNKDNPVDGNYRLACNLNTVDNSNQGHHEILCDLSGY